MMRNERYAQQLHELHVINPHRDVDASIQAHRDQLAKDSAIKSSSDKRSIYGAHILSRLGGGIESENTSSSSSPKDAECNKASINGSGSIISACVLILTQPMTASPIIAFDVVVVAVLSSLLLLLLLLERVIEFDESCCCCGFVEAFCTAFESVSFTTMQEYKYMSRAMRYSFLATSNILDQGRCIIFSGKSNTSFSRFLVTFDFGDKQATTFAIGSAVENQTHKLSLIPFAFVFSAVLVGCSSLFVDGCTATISGSISAKEVSYSLLKSVVTIELKWKYVYEWEGRQRHGGE
uniref:Uncharacterized protein n=1 Tax=Glossina brevipalpis TaxID=37001 RepID=A0A1A9WUC7_9MUSC